MKQIIVLVVSVLLTASAYAVDGKATVTVAKTDVKLIASATSRPAPRVKKVGGAVYDYQLERDGCCFSK